MCKLPTAILPQWRYWPAVPLVGLFLLGVLGSSCEPQNTAQHEHAAQNAIDDKPTFFFWVWQLADTHNKGIEAISAALLVVITAFLMWVAWQQFRTARAELRAYVQMSHKPPGLRLDADRASVVMQIKNHGSTPARVEYVLMKFEVLHPGEKLPIEPDYVGGTKMPSSAAFLVSGKKFYIPGILNIRTNDAADLRNGVSTAIVYGYVQYLDAFRRRHRAGYARQIHSIVATQQSRLRERGRLQL